MESPSKVTLLASVLIGTDLMICGERGCSHCKQSLLGKSLNLMSLPLCQQYFSPFFSRGKVAKLIPGFGTGKEGKKVLLKSRK